VIVVDRQEALEEHIPAWEALAAEALEPNVFYEPWMLLPAWRYFGTRRDIRVVLVFRTESSGPAGSKSLCGVFPIERERWYRELPVRVVRLWKHPHCFLGTPLIRADFAVETLAAFLDWLVSDERLPSMMEFRYIPSEGSFSQLLVDELNRRELLSFVPERFTRALFRPTTDGANYLEAALSGKRRKELRRQANRLSERGRLECLQLSPQGDVQAWIQDFLSLEASGWKGKDGGALAVNEATREFFLAVVTEAFRQDRLMMSALTLDGRPIAQKCNFLAAPGSFAYKIAYDETYAGYSPGVHLEIENIRCWGQRPEIVWMDSCAVWNHFMATRLWTERRTIQTVLVATGRWPSDAVVSVLPLRVWLRHRLVKWKLLQRETGF
jgi:CelD/BcsL family acetyltransferase involved in cellulose biosynthesis